MVQRYRYSVTVVDRRTGAESQRLVEAISAADAEAIVSEDEDVFVGRAEREDGTPEASGSPFDRVSYLGYDPSEVIEREFGASADEQRAYEHADATQSAAHPMHPADLRDLVDATKLVSDRLAWIQSFLVWTFYGISLILACWTVSMIFISMGAASDSASGLVWYLMPAVPIAICVGILKWLLGTIYPSFRVRPRVGEGWTAGPAKRRKGRRRR